MKHSGTQPNPIALAGLRKGSQGRVVSLSGDETTQNRLRELGLRESADVAVLHVNGSILCQVDKSRFGLDRAIAENVLVEPRS